MGSGPNDQVGFTDQRQVGFEDTFCRRFFIIEWDQSLVAVLGEESACGFCPCEGVGTEDIGSGEVDFHVCFGAALLLWVLEWGASLHVRNTQMEKAHVFHHMGFSNLGLRRN